jgi:hypothetical protein
MVAVFPPWFVSSIRHGSCLHEPHYPPWFVSSRTTFNSPALIRVFTNHILTKYGSLRPSRLCTFVPSFLPALIRVLSLWPSFLPAMVLIFTNHILIKYGSLCPSRLCIFVSSFLPATVRVFTNHILTKYGSLCPSRLCTFGALLPARLNSCLIFVALLLAGHGSCLHEPHFNQIRFFVPFAALYLCEPPSCPPWFLSSRTTF